MTVDIVRARPLARRLFDYNRLDQKPRAADVLIVMGTNDTRVADYAALLNRKFPYARIVTTGGVRHERALTGEVFENTEARKFQAILAEYGVSPLKTLIENRATNTGENITFTRELLDQAAVVVKTGQLVHTPFMERRAYATAMKQWPEVDWTVSSPDLTYEAYMAEVDEPAVIHQIVGDTFKVLSYPEKGFQIEQEMGIEIRATLTELISLGFTKHLPTDFKSALGSIH